MSQGPALGLGLALAQPNRGVVVVNGDGCMLMSLGSLVTMANHPANLYLLILDNALYEVTGGQPTAGTGHVDFAAMARAAGIRRVYAFDAIDDWRAKAAEALTGPGPVVVWLRVEGKHGQTTPKAAAADGGADRAIAAALGHSKSWRPCLSISAPHGGAAAPRPPHHAAPHSRGAPFCYCTQTPLGYAPPISSASSAAPYSRMIDRHQG